jgi:hypothetical protein
VLVLAEEKDLAIQSLRAHHDEGELEQGEETPFVRAESIGEVWRARSDRLHGQRVPRFAPEFDTELPGSREDLDGGEIHSRPTPFSSPAIGVPGPLSSLSSPAWSDSLASVISWLLWLSTSTQFGGSPRISGSFVDVDTCNSRKTRVGLPRIPLVRLAGRASRWTSPIKCLFALRMERQNPHRFPRPQIP